MNPSDWNPLYVTLAGLGLAGVIVVALAELASRRASRAQAQRAIWLSAATLLVCVTLAEWFGARAALEPLWNITKKPAVEVRPQVAPQPEVSTKPQPVPLRISESTVRLTATPLVEATPTADRTAGWLAIVWIGGTGLLLARCGLALVLLPLVRRRFGPVDDAELLSLAKEVRERLGMKRTPELRQGTVASPMTFGLLRPVVCLPADFAEAFPQAQQRAVLAHEFAHVAALDAVWRCLGEVLTALLWWHPAVWLVRRRLHSACEIAADEASRLTGPVSGDLAEALVALAGKPGPVAPWPMLAAAGDGYHSDLGQRVERLLEIPDRKPSLPNAGWRWSASALFAAIAFVFSLSACQTGGESPAKQMGKVLQKDETQKIQKEEKPKDTNLITRTFKVDPNTFVQGLENVMEVRSDRSEKEQTSETMKDLMENIEKIEIFTLRRPPGPPNMHSQVRSYLAKVGVDLTPPKAIFFNDRTGLLLVRATAADLELVQTAINLLNVAPPQITIETKWIEVTEEGMKVLAKEWPALSPHPVADAKLSGDQKAKKFKEENPTLRVDSSTSEKAAILTSQQVHKLVKSIQETKGVSIKSTPKVTTLSGRQAQISTLELMRVVTGVSSTNSPSGTSDITYDTSAIPFGPTCDLIPYVEADGITLALTVIAWESEFLGYDDPKEFVPERAFRGAEPLKGTLPLPRIRTRYFTSSARILDGQSLLLGGLTTTTTNTVHGRVKVDGTIESDTDTKGAPAEEKKLGETGGVYAVNATGYVTTKTTNHLFLLITPTIIDPAGNRVHNDGDIKALNKNAGQ
jgi:beta-lactamase regulating signal transducer with metallopeptidase domain